MALWSYLLPPRRYEVAARASLGRLGSAPRLSPALRAISDPSEHLYREVKVQFMPIPDMLNLASITNSDSLRSTSLPLRPKGLLEPLSLTW